MTSAARTLRIFAVRDTRARALALAVATVASAASAPHPANAATGFAATPACRTQRNVARVLHRTSLSSRSATQIAVARVALSRDGLVRRIAIHPTGDRAFDAAALRAIEGTAFAPAARSCAAIDSDFEYVLVARPNGLFASAIVPTHADLLASH